MIRIFGLALYMIVYETILFFVESIRYWNDVKLWRARWLLFAHYLLVPLTPDHFLDDFTYGETPFLTTDALLRWSGIQPGSVIWDLGCGRGTLVLFAAIRWHARVIAVDVFSIFITLGNLITRKLHIQDNIEWIYADFFDLDFNALLRPDLVYLPSTAFSWPTIQEITKKLEALPKGTKVISLSTLLPSKQYRALDRRVFWFSWGKATAYLQERA